MANIVFKKRLTGGYKYLSCPQCYHEIEIDKPKHSEIPYCKLCNGIILDLTQKFCCWCGIRLIDEAEEIK